MPKIGESFSDQQIDEFVDKLLANNSINMSLMPDYIEKKLYKNVFSICLGILDTLLDTVKIEFMGHKIVIDLAADTADTVDTADTAENITGGVDEREFKPQDFDDTILMPPPPQLYRHRDNTADGRRF